ncbi:MAG TPA: right-handed parallel beta-helix repeat-containing protein [Acidobacteriaceae bacterium]|nr:right-handed parallel beta-helix repeat-containing protein [Acidobacteriaceae bacterium]
MSQPEFPVLNRRTLARTALFGGASALFSASPLSASALAAQPAPANRGLLDVHTFGAAGDGKTDDTGAIQRAIDTAAESSGGVFLPPAVYVTRELHVRPGIALVGIPAWNYTSGGGTVLRLADASSPGLLNLTDARGSTIDGLALEGSHLGTNVHGIFTARSKYGEHEDGFRIERCQIAHFSGDGISLSHAWCFSVRHCEMMANHGDGLRLRGWDGFILDNWLSGNGRAGFAARDENASVTFTANRVEWNSEENMVIVGGDGYQITGNFFDRAGTVGIALRHNPQAESWNKGPCTQVAITGNFVKRSGKFAKPESHDSAQILLEDASGVTCVSNVLEAGQDDGDKGIWSPSYGLICGGLENCIVAHNTLHKGALRQLLVDLGNHRSGVLIKDNTGSVFTPQP